jgi:hypothetical protein
MRVDQGSATNEGTINVTGNKENYGIYATSGETEAQSVAVTNTGTININGTGKNTGIYASGAYASVINTGTIKINDEENTTICEEECDENTAIVLKNDAKLYNDGEVTTTGSLNFDDMGGEVILSENGKFEAAEDISGNLSVSSAVVLQNFDEDVVLENALTAKSIDNLNLNSKSYLYTVAALASGKETNDVILTKKAFSEVTDANKAAYLENNYTAKKNNTLFNTLKSAETAAEYSKTEAATFGTSVLPNMTEENLKVMRSLDKKMVDELFTEGGEIRKMVGGDALYVGRDDHGNLSGYDLYSQSIYSLYDKKINNHYRLGAGLSLTHSSTDYNNDSSRKNFMIQGYVPLTYNFGNGLTAVSMAQLGYSNGEYKRRGYNHTYEADTSDINYGLQNEIRYRTSVLGVNITPFAGLNILGWYQNSVKEDGDDLALRLDSANVFSLESALGLYVDKDIEFDTDNKLNIALGVGYYHEFADPYRGIDAQVRDTIGKYKVRENIASRDRGAISAKVNYDYKAFSLYGELMQYLEREYPLKVDVGVKYNF